VHGSHDAVALKLVAHHDSMIFNFTKYYRAIKSHRKTIKQFKNQSHLMLTMDLLEPQVHCEHEVTDRQTDRQTDREPESAAAAAAAAGWPLGPMKFRPGRRPGPGQDAGHAGPGRTTVKHESWTLRAPGPGLRCGCPGPQGGWAGSGLRCTRPGGLSESDPCPSEGRRGPGGPRGRLGLGLPAVSLWPGTVTVPQAKPQAGATTSVPVHSRPRVTLQSLSTTML